jgi:TP901 family phage tail tape measure protein
VAGGGNKSVRLYLLGNNLDAREKIDAIERRAEELKEMHPELRFGVETAAAQEKLAIMRAELRETGAAAEESGLKMEAFGRDATISSETMAKAWEVAKLAILGIGAALGFGIYKAAGFQQQIELIHTQAGVSQGALQFLGNGVLKLAGQVGQAPDSLAESLYHVESAFASMGITGPKALSLVKIAAEGARVGNANLVDVTNALGAAIASGIPGVENYSQAMGALNSIVGSGDMHMQDLAEAMGTGMLAVVKGFGLSLNDVGAALATFGDNNIRGADSATALRMTVMSLAAPAAAGKKQLQEWGITAGNLSEDMKKHGLLGALEHLQALFKANGVTAKDQGQVITEMFGHKAGTGINVLMDQMDRLKSKYPEIEKGAAGFGKAWDATDQTVQQQFADLKDGSEALAISLGEKLLPSALRVEKWLVGFVNGLENGSVKATAIAGLIGTVFAGIALKKLEEGLKGSVEGFENLWKAGQKVTGWIGSAVTKLGIFKTAQEAETVATDEAAAAQEGLNLAFLGSPVTWIVLGLVAIGAGIYELSKHSKAFRDFWIHAWHDVLRIVDVTFGWIKGHWPLLASILLGPIAFAAFEIAAHWRQIWHGAQEAYHFVVNVFADLRRELLHLVSDFGHLLWNAGASLIHGLVGGITNVEHLVWDKIYSIGHGISGVFKSVMSIFSPSRVFWEHGMNIVLGLVGGIDGYAHLAENSVRNLANRAIGASSGRFYGAAAAGGGGAALTVEWIGGTGADQEFITWLKKNIRIRGGDPSVLGR